MCSMPLITKIMIFIFFNFLKTNQKFLSESKVVTDVSMNVIGCQWQQIKSN